LARGDGVQKIAAERIEFASDSIASGGFETERTQRVVMEAKNEFGFDACAKVLAIREELRDAEELVGHALHCGDDDDHVGILRDGLDEFGGVQHSGGAEE
jgi:hypothetical protein